MGRLKRLLKTLGPGFITGASDDDPSGIGTYSVTGVQFGFGQLWTALFSFPFMSAVQEMCGRIGLVTGKGLAGNIRRHYSRPLLYFAVLTLLVANMVNIGANLGAMASAGQLLWNIPYAVWLIGVTAVTLVLQVFVNYSVYTKYLKYLALSLLAYVITAFVIKVDWGAALSATVMPSFVMSKEYLLNIVAILGTTISPYLFFWQAGEEAEEEVREHKLRIMGWGIPKVTSGDIKTMRIDTLIGMLFSNMVMFFIIVVSASQLAGVDLQTADQAAKALEPVAGRFAFLLFSTGIIGTGLLAVPVLAGSASYALSEAFGWKEGLYRKFQQAHGFYGVITVATLFGLLVNFTGVPPFKLLYYTAILNGICAPPLLILIMMLANNRDVMGKYTNTRLSNVLGWTITAIMGVCGLGLIASAFMG